ncbi:MAG TPA: efflux transporter outer membrane subunit [Thermoanaerobaculia bacterium]|nr:efflux transporter outer membrane subunit [Thermoanaerobaculia bacterium]
MRRPVVGRVPAAFAVLLTAACAVGPNYRKPEVPVSDRYRESPPPDWEFAAPSDGIPRGPWWEMFGDPGLDALEEQVAISNQNVKQAEAAYRVARAVARGARADLFPTVTGNAGVTRSQGAAHAATGAGATPGVADFYSVSADVSWEIDVWGRIRRNVEAQVEAAQASEADLENARLSFQAELAADYFALREADAEKDLLDTNVAGYERALTLTTDRFRQGVVSAVDVAQAQTQLSATRAQATDVALRRAQLEHAIAVLVGKPPAALSLPPAPLTADPPAIPTVLPSELVERRPDVASAERQVAAANARIGVAEAAFFPALGLSASGGYGNSVISHLFSLPDRFWSIGASLVGTLFSGGKRRAAKEQAVAGYDAAVASYRQSVLTAFQDVEDQLAALRLLGDEAKDQAEAVAAAERSLSLAQTRYTGGITSYLEVITAETAALANERAAVQLRDRRMAAAVSLVRALGGGWRASDLPSGSAVLSHSAASAPRRDAGPR